MNQTTQRRRRVWNKDDVPRMAAAAPHASVAPTPAAPATPHGDVPKITPKSRDLVRRMLQAEHLGFQFTMVNMMNICKMMMRMIMIMIWMLCFFVVMLVYVGVVSADDVGVVSASKVLFRNEGLEK